MSHLEKIKTAMIEGEHTDGDLEWCVQRIAELEKLNKNLERQFVEDTAKIQELENLLTGRGPSQVS